MIPWPVMVLFWLFEIAITPVMLTVILFGVLVQWIQRKLQWGKRS